MAVPANAKKRRQCCGAGPSAGPSTDAATADGQEGSDEDDANEEAEEKDGEEGEEEADDDMQLAWENLEVAKSIYERNKHLHKDRLTGQPSLENKADWSWRRGILRLSGAPRDTIKCRIYLLIRLRCFWHSGFQSTFSMMGPEFCSNCKGLSQISCRHAGQHAATWLLQVC